MPHTTFNFLQCFPTNVLNPPIFVLNIIPGSWEEAETEMNGGRQRAFNGDMLVTENGGKFAARGTVVFHTSAERVAFENALAQDWDTSFQRPKVYRPMLLVSSLDGLGRSANSGRVNMVVWMRLGKKVPFEHVVPNPASPANPTLELGWTCELIVEQL